MQKLKEGVLLSYEEYNKYLRMEACIEELQRTSFQNSKNPEVEA